MVSYGNKSKLWIFLKNNIISITLFTIVIVSTIYFISNRLYRELTTFFRQEASQTVDAMVKNNNNVIDYKTICIMTNCLALTNKETGEIVYVNSDRKIPTNEVYNKSRQVLTVFKTNGTLEDFIINLKPYITYKDMVVYSDTSIKLSKLKNKHILDILVYSSVWFFSGMLILVMFRVYIRKYQGIRDREVMEERLRKQLTESVHHELSGPLSTIKANLRAGFSGLYPCKRKGGGCTAPSGEVDSTCDGCKFKDMFKSPSEDSVYWNYVNANTAIEQMQSVLNIMANAKHIQYTNGSVSLSKIMDNLSSSKRLVTYNLVKVEVINQKGLERYACGNGLNNGDLINILSSMLNNSIEAEANKITISWEVKDKDFIYLYLKDNGYGVRDNKHRLIKDVNKFKIKYGYSTKISPYDLGDLLNKRKIFSLITNIIGSDIDYVKVRGSGLHLNKEILEIYGGTITLFDNSENGATFRVTIPIKEVHFDELESKVIKNV